MKVISFTAKTSIGACARDWKVLFLPDAKVVHHKGISSRTQPLTVEYYKHLGMVRFYRKLLSQTRPRWFLTLVAAGIWTRYGGIVALHLLSQAAQRIRGVFRSAS